MTTYHIQRICQPQFLTIEFIETRHEIGSFRSPFVDEESLHGSRVLLCRLQQHRTATIQFNAMVEVVKELMTMPGILEKCEIALAPGGIHKDFDELLFMRIQDSHSVA